MPASLRLPEPRQAHDRDSRLRSGFDELEACVQLQIETWGYDASDVIPRKRFWWRRRSAAR
jgi:hypothetical protein